MGSRGALRYGFFLTGLGLALADGTAYAQTTPTAATPSESTEGGGLAEVIVTARKTAEREQDVPIAVTAFSTQDLESRHAVSLADLSGIAPGLTVENSVTTGGSVAFFSLRGQYQSSTLATDDPSVGVYVDGVYWARAFGINANLLDISDVQVLRGPQGTLFGRNTNGGAILINSADPRFGEFSGTVTGEYGRFNHKQGTAVFNAPLIQDKLALRVAFQAVNDDGYVSDAAHPYNKDGNVNQYEMRVKLLGQVTDSLRVLLSADIYNDDYRGDDGQIRYVTTSSYSNLEAGAELLGAACFTDTAACFAAGRNRIFGETAAAAANPDQVSYNIVPSTQTRTQTYTATITDDTPVGTAKLIGSYRAVREFILSDYDGSDVNIDTFNTFENLRQWSVEAQLAGDTLNHRVTYAGGLFGFGESGVDSSLFWALPAISPSIIKYYGVIDNKSLGVYEQSSLRITDKLSLTLGLRWSEDQKAVTINNGSGTGDIYNLRPGTFVCEVSAGCPTSREGTFTGVNYTGGFDYKFTPDILAYIKAASSFRSGGVNLRETTAIPGLPAEPFKPERAISYEAGLKSEWLDHRVRANVAGYYMIVHDLQREFVVSNGIESSTIEGNAGRADFYGGEAELAAQLFDIGKDSLTFGGNAALIIPEYKDYKDIQTGFDRSHESFPYTPRWQTAVSLTFKHALDLGTAALFTEYHWDSGYQMATDGYYVDANGVAHDASTGNVLPMEDAVAIHNFEHKGPSGVLNAKASFTFGDAGRYEVAAFGHNIANNRQFDNAGVVTALAISSLRMQPATWGLSFTARF